MQQATGEGMASGQLVVVNRSGNDGRKYALATGLVTLGRDPTCDIRIMLPDVSLHHATIIVRNKQTVVRNLSESSTLVNGRAVSVAALKHGDVITLGDRSLRWEYNAPDAQAGRNIISELPVFPSAMRVRSVRRTRASDAARRPVDRHLELLLELKHRASMPSGDKQVAIVQPQRRDTATESNDKPRLATKPHRPYSQTKRNSKQKPKNDTPKPKPASKPATPNRKSPRTTKNGLVDTTNGLIDTLSETKASQWIASRKNSSPYVHVATPRPKKPYIGTPTKLLTPVKRATPLRTAVLRKTVTPIVKSTPKQRSVQKTPKIMKIEEPLVIDEHKRAALMLLTRTPRSKLLLNKMSPLNNSLRKTPMSLTSTPVDKSTKKYRSFSTPNLSNGGRETLHRLSRRSGRKDKSVSVFEITDSTIPDRRCDSVSTVQSEMSPRKSSLKDPHSRTRKTESIKFDLSNLESYADSDVQILSRTSVSEPNLRYSDTRVSNQTRSSRIIEKSLGVTFELTPKSTMRRTKSQSPSILEKSIGDTLERNSPKKSTRSSLIMKNALENKTGKSYSVVDLVSFDSNTNLSDSFQSSSTAFGTPGTHTSLTTRQSRSGKSFLGTSTPYIKPNTSRSKELRHSSAPTLDSSKDKTLFLSTPNSPTSNTSTPRKSKSTFTIDKNASKNVTDQTSKRRSTRNSNSPSTPENDVTLGDVGTPILDMKSLLDSSVQPRLSRRKTVGARTSKVKIGILRGARTDPKRRSRAGLNLSAAKKKLLNKSDVSNASNVSEENVTPKSTINIKHEAVKQQHSTAKKSISKRSIIDNLNESTIVKDLFSSPVKRKLSQSMTEFTKNDHASPKRTSSRSAASTPEFAKSKSSPKVVVTSNLSAKETSKSPKQTNSRTLRTPQNKSPKNDLTKVSGVKSVFRASPRNDLANVSGVKDIMAKKSPNNDLRRVTGVKSLFGKRKSPKNDLSDVRGIKKLYRTSPKNDLTRVSGVKRILTQKSPTNDLTNVSGVRNIFRKKDISIDPDLSGIGLLFDRPEPNDLFDQLLGKPKIKATYSRSFVDKSKKKPTKGSKSLTDVSVNNVEQWLEEELQKRVKDKSKVARELKKLATDTIEGVSPLPLRSKRKTLKKSLEGFDRKSLPIKKRSLLLALENEKFKLPLKKRSLVHSTPVKGDRSSVVSELDRVSPITAPRADDLDIVDITQVSFKSISPKVVKKNTRVKKATKATTPKSPKQTRRKTNKKENTTMLLLEVPKSSPPGKTRGKKLNVTKEISVTKGKTRAQAKRGSRGPAVVVVKPSPVIKKPPKREKKVTPKETAPSPPKRRTRKADIKIEVEKASPATKPRRAQKEKQVKTPAKKAVKSEKKKPVDKPESPVKPKSKSSAKPKSPIKPKAVAKPKSAVKPKSPAKSKSKAKPKPKSPVKPKPAETRATRGRSKVEEPKTEAKATSKPSRKRAAPVEEKQVASKRKRTAKEEKVEEKPAAATRATRGKKNTKNTDNKENETVNVKQTPKQTRARSRKPAEKPQEKKEPPKRATKKQAEEAKPARGGKKNIEVTPKSPLKTRTRKHADKQIAQVEVTSKRRRRQ